MWKVYDKTGKTVRCDVRKVQYSGTFMGECFVNTTLYSDTPIDFEIGDYLLYRNEYFSINYDPSVLKKSGLKKNGEAYTYDGVKFNSNSDELTRCDFLDYVLHDNGVHFSSLPNFSFYASSIQDLADRIQANLDRIYKGEEKWTVIVHPEFVDTTNVNIEASKIKVWGALDFIKSKFKANFIIRGRNIIIGTAGIAIENVFQYGKDKGLFEIQRVAESNQQIITRLRVYGSTRNLPARYYNKLSDSTLENFLPNNMAVQNLMLPDFPYKTLDAYIDSPNISALGIREDSVYFDGSDESMPEIFPSMEGMTAQQLIDAGISCSIDTGDNGNLDEVHSDSTNKDGSAITDDGAWSELKEGADIPQFLITLKDICFDINKYLTGESATISMKSGMCGGRDFEITKCVKSGNKYVLTCNRVYDDGLKLYFPYKSYNIKAGDKFVLLNIDMPEVYISAAAQRLLKAGKEYLAKNDYVRYTYEVKIDEIYMARHPQFYSILKEGDLMLFTEPDFHIDGSIIIDSLRITEGEGVIPTYEVTLADDKQVGTIEKIQNVIDSIAGGQGSSGYNSQQIDSLIRVFGRKYFLSKLYDDTASGLLTFLKGLVSEELIEANNGINIGEAIDSLISGKGTLLRPDGSIQADSVELRRSLTVLELIFNRLSAQESDTAFSESGVIESIELLGDGTYRLPLRKRHTTDFTAFDWNDIIYGSVNDLATGGGNYRTSWMRVVGVNTVDSYIEAVLYPDDEVPGGKNYPPEPLMIITRRGNTSDEDRQSYWYISSYEKCICMLDGVTKPILEENNYSILIGKMKRLSLFDNLPINYRQSYVYCRGLIRQDDIRIDVTGKPVYEFVNRGIWSLSVATSEEPYLFESKNPITGVNESSTVYHRGLKWQCLKTGTLLEPKWNSTDWAFLEGNGEFSIDFQSSKGFSFFYGLIDTVIEARFYHGTTDITEDVMSTSGTVITWNRDTGIAAEDNAWSPTFVDGKKNKIHLISSDMGSQWLNARSVTFKITAVIPLGEENYLRESEELQFNL